jgi:hypothetical protein
MLIAYDITQNLFAPLGNVRYDQRRPLALGLGSAWVPAAVARAPPPPTVYYRISVPFVDILLYPIPVHTPRMYPVIYRNGPCALYATSLTYPYISPLVSRGVSEVRGI